jgi:hypothetical protein
MTHFPPLCEAERGIKGVSTFDYEAERDEDKGGEYIFN